MDPGAGGDPSPAADVSRLDEIGAELEAVDAALGRLDDGTYGACAVCGRALDRAGPEADPLATRCAEHRR